MLLLEFGCSHPLSTKVHTAAEKLVALSRIAGRDVVVVDTALLPVPPATVLLRLVQHVEAEYNKLASSTYYFISQRRVPKHTSPTLARASFPLHNRV